MKSAPGHLTNPYRRRVCPLGEEKTVYSHSTPAFQIEAVALYYSDSFHLQYVCPLQYGGDEKLSAQRAIVAQSDGIHEHHAHE